MTTHPIAPGRKSCGGPGICPTCSAIYGLLNPSVALPKPDGSTEESEDPTEP